MQKIIWEIVISEAWACEPTGSGWFATSVEQYRCRCRGLFRSIRVSGWGYTQFRFWEVFMHEIVEYTVGGSKRQRAQTAITLHHIVTFQT